MGSGASTNSRSPEIQKIMMGRLASTLVPGSVVYPMNELFNHIHIYQNCKDGNIIIMFDELLEQNKDCTRWNELFLAPQGVQYFEECDRSLTPKVHAKLVDQRNRNRHSVSRSTVPGSEVSRDSIFE